MESTERRRAAFLGDEVSTTLERAFAEQGWTELRLSALKFNPRLVCSGNSEVTLHGFVLFICPTEDVSGRLDLFRSHSRYALLHRR
jgi:hypothetical protein